MPVITPVKPEPAMIRNRSNSFRCSSCHELVRKGMQFYSIAGGERVHLECLAETASAPTACTTCFMVRCEC